VSVLLVRPAHRPRRDHAGSDRRLTAGLPCTLTAGATNDIDDLIHPHPTRTTRNDAPSDPGQLVLVTSLHRPALRGLHLRRCGLHQPSV